MNESTRTEQRVERHRRELAGLLTYILLAALVIGVLGIVVQTYTLAATIRDQQKVTATTNQRLIDCTTPTGECYKQGQKRTARAVSDIGKVAAYAAACADQPGRQGQAEVLECVLRRLAADKRHP